MRFLAKHIIYTLMMIVMSIVLFAGTSALLMFFPVNDSVVYHKTDKPAIALTHDLAHVNILIDLSQSSTPWQTLVPDIVSQRRGYLLVGWGDRQTYLSTPSWSDLSLGVASQALLYNTPSALHLRYLPEKDRLRATVTPLWVSETVSRRIEEAIVHYFATGEGEQTNTPVLLAPGYDAGDRFYYAQGKYNLFHTCNSWVGEVLRQSGVPVSRWTPFSYNVVYSIPLKYRAALHEISNK